MRDLATLSGLPLRLSLDGGRIETAWPPGSPSRPRPLQRPPGSFGLHHPSEHWMCLLLDPKRSGALPHTPKQKSYAALRQCLPTMTPTLAALGGPFASYAEAGGSLPSGLPRDQEELRRAGWTQMVAWAAQSEQNDPGGEASNRLSEDMATSEDGFYGLARTGAVGYILEALRQLLRDEGTLAEPQIEQVVAAAGEVARPTASAAPQHAT